MIITQFNPRLQSYLSMCALGVHMPLVFRFTPFTPVTGGRMVHFDTL